MSRIRVHRPEDLQWVTMREIAPPQVIDKLSDTELDSTTVSHEDGSANSPQLREMHYRPGAEVDVHAHDADEIIYVLEGSIFLGNSELCANGSVFIAADTLYSFRAGPVGARLALFRPRGGVGYQTRDEFMARRVGQDGNAAH